MSAVSLRTFIDNVALIKSKSPTYRTGGRGADGTCDCVGLIMGAMYRAGHKVYDLHSSNYFARWQMVELEEICDEDDCYVGLIVYKRGDGSINERYLSGRYSNGDEQDYYHVGIVTGIEPLSITHCTSSDGVNGITVDTKLGKWSCGGRLKGIDYSDYELGDDGMAVYENGVSAVVKSDNKEPVRMRKSPSTTAEMLCKVDVDMEVTVYESASGWSQIEHDGQRGYMMTKFLDIEDDSCGDVTSDDDSSDDTSGYGLWIPCASKAAATTLRSILSTGIVRGE